MIIVVVATEIPHKNFLANSCSDQHLSMISPWEELQKGHFQTKLLVMAKEGLEYYHFFPRILQAKSLF